MITSLQQLDLTQEYSYADYLLWRFQERVELIRGRIRQMAAPSTLHQSVSSKIHVAVGIFLQKSPCKVFSAPFDVRLTPTKVTPDGKIYDVVQPDLVVVCDPLQLDAKGCIGAPDLVVEILSPGNNRKELKDKFDLYEVNGIKEYWIVSPTEQTMQVNVLTNGRYIPSRLFTRGDIVVSTVLNGFALDLNEVFEEVQ
jgi:Uma2 family endonuclease